MADIQERVQKRDDQQNQLGQAVAPGCLGRLRLAQRRQNGERNHSGRTGQRGHPAPVGTPPSEQALRGELPFFQELAHARQQRNADKDQHQIHPSGQEAGKKSSANAGVQKREKQGSNIQPDQPPSISLCRPSLFSRTGGVPNGPGPSSAWGTDGPSGNPPTGHIMFSDEL